MRVIHIKNCFTLSLLILSLLFSGCTFKLPITSQPDELSSKTEEQSSSREIQPAGIKKQPTKIAIYCEELLVIGEAEHVLVGPEGMKLSARIDTGATTSSLNAIEIENYERDEKKWVRFKIVNPVSGESLELNKPLVRMANIKRHGAPDQNRPAVKLQMKLGPIDVKTEFTLTDRSKFEYPVLIGRSFLDGVAVVDVGRKYVTSPFGGE